MPMPWLFEGTRSPFMRASPRCGPFATLAVSRALPVQPPSPGDLSIQYNEVCCEACTGCAHSSRALSSDMASGVPWWGFWVSAHPQSKMMGLPFHALPPTLVPALGVQNPCPHAGPPQGDNPAVLAGEVRGFHVNHKPAPGSVPDRHQRLRPAPNR
jgi:hypothetical protein